MTGPDTSVPAWEHPTLTPLARGDHACDPHRLARLAAQLDSHPDNPQAWYELGCAYNREGRYAEAVEALECCHALSPRSLAVQSELAYALSGTGAFGDAGGLFESVINQDPGNGWAHFHLAALCYRMNALQDAVELWECAARLLTDPCDCFENLAMVYRRVGDTEQEKRCWQRLRDVSAEHPAVRHMLAAHGQAPLTARADDAYVRHLFDRFSRDFDAVLKALDYRVPDLLEEQLRDCLGQPSPALTILDAGCGTGLCGERLRPWARQLTGVDLSAGMLVKAQQRRVYDDLVESEILAFLAKRPEASYHWIVAGDVLCYFGDLGEVVAAARRCLVPGGRFFLTVEEDGSDPGPSLGYRLQPHGRYCHTHAYLEATAREAAMSVAAMATTVLRHEAGHPVSGMWAVLLSS